MVRRRPRIVVTKDPRARISAQGRPLDEDSSRRILEAGVAGSAANRPSPGATSASRAASTE